MGKRLAQCFTQLFCTALVTYHGKDRGSPGALAAAVDILTMKPIDQLVQECPTIAPALYGAKVVAG